MQSEWVDFRAVKAAVGMEATLAQYRIKLKRVNRSSLRGNCPLPSHTSKGSPTFCVNTDKNAWSCASDSCVKGRGGRRGGNVLDFVAIMENCSIRDAALKLANWFNVSSDGGRSSPAPEVKPTGSDELVAKEKRGEGEVTNTAPSRVENKPLGFALKSIDHSHPYLTARGITRETAAHFGVGFFSGRGSMAGRVVIPIRNRGGELVAYAGRAIDNTEPKYKLPGGFHKSMELFNLDRVRALGGETRAQSVVVVEGFFDCMKVHQAGFPNVVALIGCSLSETQEDLLAEHFNAALLCLDGDEAGRNATAEILPRLAQRMFTRVVALPADRQADMLTAEELQALLPKVKTC
jgi:DNA primase